MEPRLIPVVGIQPYGVFVRYSAGQDVLVNVRHLPDDMLRWDEKEKAKVPDLQLGTELSVQVRTMRPVGS